MKTYMNGESRKKWLINISLTLLSPCFSNPDVPDILFQHLSKKN